MSETKHTPEPWHIEKTVHAKDADGGYETWISAEWGINEWHGLAFTFGDEDSEDQAIANARRIVACVNACAGIEQKILEDPEYSIKAELDSLDSIIETSAKYLAQRDELLAALTHAATDYIDQNGSVPSWWTDKIRQMVKPHA